MNMPAFTAQSSLYRTHQRYHTSMTEFDGLPTESSVTAAYIPGPRTQNRCSGCTDVCVAIRDVCLAKTALMVTEGCWATLGFGCGPVVALGVIQAASCEAAYLECFGDCNIPSLGPWNSPCCPKPCGFPTPGVAGSGCCDEGETCKGLGAHDNTRDGCCPVGRDCGSMCCAAGEKCCGEICCPDGFYCLDSKTCSEYPGTFSNTYPPPQPATDACAFFEGGSRCGNKCCYGGLQCCGTDPHGNPDCRASCLR